jgi:hypothetical protein
VLLEVIDVLSRSKKIKQLGMAGALGIKLAISHSLRVHIAIEG